MSEDSPEATPLRIAEDQLQQLVAAILAAGIQAGSVGEPAPGPAIRQYKELLAHIRQHGLNPPTRE